MATYYGNYHNHQDLEVGDEDYVDQEYGKKIEYKKQRRESTYGLIGKNGDNVKVERPVDDVETLIQQKHLEALFHKQNREKWEKSPHPNDGENLFNVQVKAKARKYLQYYDIDVETGEAATSLYPLLLLMTVAGYDITDNAEFKPFVDTYLKELDPQVQSEFGFDDISSVPSPVRLYKHANRLTDHEVDGLEKASIQLTFDLYRHGIVPPEAVKDRFNLGDVEPPLDERKLRQSDIREATREWIRKLIDETLDPLTFGRNWCQNDIVSRLGLLASSALYGGGVSLASDLSGSNYDEENIPGGGHLQQNLIDFVPLMPTSFGASTKRDVLSIQEQFDQIHRNTLEVAKDLGILDGPKLLAIDETTKKWTGSQDAPTVEQGPRPGTDSTSDWKFKVLNIVRADSPFTIGVRPIFDASNNSYLTKNLINQIPSDLEIQAIMADSGEVSGDLMDAFNSAAGEKWLTKAPENFPVKELIWATPSNAVGYTDRIDWFRDSGTSLFVFPHNRFLQKENEDGEETFEDPVEEIYIPSKLLDNRNDPLHERNKRKQKLSQYGEDVSLDEPHPLERHVIEESNQTDPPNVGVGNTHLGLFTDMDMSVHSPLPARLNYHYRWGAEEANNQLKNYFLPKTESAEKEPRLFFMNIAVMFRNWISIINRAPSPESSLRLDVTHQEVLQAIEHVAFSHNSE